METRSKVRVRYEENTMSSGDESDAVPAIISVSSSVTSVTTMSSITTATSLVSSSIMSPAISISPSSLHSIPVEELERQVALAKEELRRKQLLHEFQQLKAATAEYSVNVAPAPSPSISVAPLASSDGAINTITSNRLDLPRLRSDEKLRREVDKQIRLLGLHGPNELSSTSSSNSDSDSSSDSDSHKRKHKKAKKKSKRKSGKFSKPSSKVTVVQDWPQAYLSLKYVTKAKKYEALSIPEFVAGFSAILQKPKLPDIERKARTKHLKDLMYLATIHKWNVVLEFHASVLCEIERGHLTWSDSFDSLMSRFLATHSSNNSASGSRSSSNSTAGGTSSRIFFCRHYNNGHCTKPDTHTDMVNGISVSVRHICAQCWLTNRTVQSHQQSSPMCPSRNSSIPSSTPSTSG